ncbi:MAG: dynamin family protein [Polaromonas sp.]|nr:dynamin family protein [Polaromonas sp.]
MEKAFAAKLERLASEELRLSIGIMGQVKAGKSSFLNALLFEGRPVLPEAATPKTANLTRISYGDKPMLTVEYYSPQEWASIKTAAANPGEHAEARVGRDLLKMVASHGVDVDAVLALGNQRIAADDISGLMDKLNDYVGENGRHTAVVKSTQIELPLEELKGFDVVDTPGMNDPVPSRTQKTREYMAQCDVVFFLSRCSQFLDQSDMDLLAGQLPGNGVKRMVLVAGQFDGAVSDDGYDRDSLADTEKNIKTRLMRRAENEMEKLAAQKGDSHIATLLRGLKTPIFASTYAHSFASQNEASWGKGMQHMHGQLQEMADSTWDGYRFTPQDWERIGNFEALKIAYNTARADKKTLLQAQREGLMPETHAELQARLQKLIEAVEHRAEQLNKGDIKAIENNLRACEGRILGISSRLSEVIDKARLQADTVFRTLKSQLEPEVDKSAKLKARTGTETQKSSYEVSTSSWYKPWSWGDKETIHYTTSSSYEYIAASDAIEKLVNYGNETAASLQREFNSIVNLATLRADLKRSLINELNTGNEGFNPADFRATLEGTLSRLKLPELRLEPGDMSRAISANFSGEVRSEQKMAALREALQQSLRTVLSNLLSAFKTSVDELRNQLALASDSLGNELAKDLQKELAQLKKAFADKEQELQVYAEILDVSQKALKE